MGNKSNVAQMRMALETANVYTKAGLEFVCIPVMNDSHRGDLIVMAHEALEEMALKAEADEK